jgi:hypothetical protein
VRINATESCTGRNRIRKKRDRNNTSAQSFTHNARSDDGGQEEGRTESLSYSTSGHSTPSTPVLLRG